MKKKLKKTIALALTVAMVFSLSMTSVFAYSNDAYSEYAPDEVMEVDDSYLSGATAAANTTAMSILGIDVTSTDVPGAIGNADDPLNLLVFGSELNEEPDPYLWNFYYNLNANGETYPNKLGEGESNTGKPIDEWKDIYKLDDYKSWKGAYTLLNYAKAGPTGAATDTGVIPIQVNSTVTTECNPLFYFEPNVLMGGTQGTYAVGLENYQNTVNSCYNPLEVYGWGTSTGQYAIKDSTVNSTFAMANGVYTMSSEIQKYAEDNKLQSRYNNGDVLQCGVDYSNFAIGMYYYLQACEWIGFLSEVRWCTGVTIGYDNGPTYTITNDHESEVLTDRYPQYFDGISTYVDDDSTAYRSTGDLKKAVDIIFVDSRSEYTDTQLRIFENANVQVVEISDILLPNTVYGTSMQSADNILGLPYIFGVLYESQLQKKGIDIGKYDFLAYFVENLYHVNPDDVDQVLDVMLGTTDHYHSTNYTSVIDSMIMKGAQHYVNHYQDTDTSYRWSAVDEGAFEVEEVVWG